MTVISNFDLHCHTKASDGGFTPSQIVMKAYERGLNYLAITDHDLVAGVQEAITCAQQNNELLKQGSPLAPKENYIYENAQVDKVENGSLDRSFNERLLTIIPGIEFSTTWRNEQIHIVGLFIDIENQTLNDLIAKKKLSRTARAIAIGEKLERLGFERPYERCREQAQEGASITRGNYARLIYQDGKARTIDEAFHKYLRRGQKAYVQNDWGPIDEAVQAIKAASGIAVLAHPRRYKISNLRLRTLIEDFVAVGGEAMEVASCQQKPNDKLYLTQLCQKYNLLASLGSDFHNDGLFRNLGQNLDLPDSLQPVWTAPCAQRFGLGTANKQRLVHLTHKKD